MYLADCSSDRGVTPTDRRIAAAYQLAIWHYTDLVPIRRNTVSSPSVRVTTRQLIREASAAKGTECPTDGGPEDDKKKPPGGGSYTPTISAATGDATSEEQVVTMVLRSGNPNSVLDNVQALVVRIEGLPAYVCTGRETTIDTGETVVAKPQPGKSAGFDACGKVDDNTPQVAQYRLKKQSSLQPNSPKQGKGPFDPALNALASLRVPRKDRTQQLRITWNSDSSPGLIFLASDGSQQIITAGVTHVVLESVVTLTPDDLPTFGTFLQRQVVAHLASWGFWGVLALLGLIGGLLTFSTWGPRFGGKLWRFATWVRRKAWEKVTRRWGWH